jgi:hypothetical protein
MKTRTFRRKGLGQEEAVSEIISTLLLVTMSVVMFSAIMVIVLDPWTNYTDDSPPLVTIVGTIHHDPVLGDQVILQQKGGITLSKYTRIKITIANTDHLFTISNSTYLNDLNGNGKWDVGEDIIYTAGDLTGVQVKCLVVDYEKNAVIMDKTIQEGSTVSAPSVTVLDPSNINETSATLQMYYNFINDSCFATGLVNFTYGPSGGPFLSTPPMRPLMIQGWFSFLVKGLQKGVLYECWAYLRYNGGSRIDGPMLFYTYQDERGLWHLDEAPGDTTAHDAINPSCNGVVHGATFGVGGKINNSLYFEGITQYVNVPHHPKFNITKDFTIKTWLNLTKIGEKFPGNITEEIDRMNFFGNLSATCSEPDIIHVENSTDLSLYAIAYHDDTQGYVSTIRITNTGDIQNVVQTIPLSVTHFMEPDIIHISGQIYAIVFGATESQVEKKGHIVTISINDAGVITQLNTFDFPAYYGREPRIVHVEGDTYAVTFGGCALSYSVQTGKLFTIAIGSSGQILNHTINELKFPQNFSSETDIIPITSNIYALIYNGIGEQEEYIRTVKILSDGTIVSGSFIDSFQFGLPSDWLEPTILHVSGDIYAISNGADSNNQQRNGFVQTVSIHSDGTIQHSVISSLSFPIPYATETEMVSVGNNIYAIAFSGGNSSMTKRGFLTTIDIDSTGLISGAVDDVYEFTGSKGLKPSILPLFGGTDRFAIVYGAGGVNTDGFLVTTKIDTVGLLQWVLQKGDMFGIKVNGNRLITTMTIGGSSYTVSGYIVPLHWSHIVLTYGLGMLSLSVNGVIASDGSVPCSGTIQTNTAPFVFGGGLYGSLDEIEIYSKYNA